MFSKRCLLTCLRMLVALSGCAALAACWWDGSGSSVPPAQTVAGTISGLSTGGLTLANGADRLNVAAGATAFSFPTQVSSGSAYAVTVAAQPANATCTVANGSGTANGTAISVQVTCITAKFHLGGTISGLTAAGLTLANGADSVSPSAGATTFTFPSTVASGVPYSVTVRAQPAGLNCTVAAGSGTMAGSDVSSVAVSCAAASYHVGGTISGLTAAGLVLANGADTVSPPANATAFSLPALVASGAAYQVTVQTQPAGLNCTVANGSGTVGSADVSTVQVSCSGGGSGFTALAGQTTCPSGHPDQNGTGSAASLAVPSSIATDTAGNIYTLSWYFGVINKITPAGVVTTVAGQYGVYGYQDGTGTAAQFTGNEILGGIDANGNLYVSETSNVRRVTPAGVVTTLAGPATAEQGYVDGTGGVARFSQWGLGVAPDGTSYVADYANHVVRKVSPTGVTSTLAGSNTQQGSVDGVGAAAQFLNPQYAVVDAAGTTYLADHAAMQVRKVTADGTVTTLAGGTSNGWADGQGTAALFYDIHGLAIGPAGSIYVLDQASAANGSSSYGDNWGAIRKITADGTVTTVVVSSASGKYFGPPAGTHVAISQPLQAIGSLPNGMLLAASQCAIGEVAVP
ncbi:MAG: hypothetical protein JSR36_07890 [Proteobacteria bacterium]|nr:hypothetical protein [Pseudomonadota bacterium]